MLTSYPSAVARTFMAAARDGTLLMHTWVTLSENHSRLCRRHVSQALVRDRAVVVGLSLPRARSIHRRPERDPEDRAGADYIWLGDTASIYAMAIAVSVFVTVLTR